MLSASAWTAACSLLGFSWSFLVDVVLFVVVVVHLLLVVL
jgi:hypothetical protein